MTEYVFLMRHAEHNHGQLTAKGIKDISAVSGRFAEWLDQRLVKVVVEFTTDLEVRRTADVLVTETEEELSRLGDTGIRLAVARSNDETPKLPSNLRTCRIGLGPYRPQAAPFIEVETWLEKIACAKDSRAPLLIGNDPMIGWLASELANEPIPVRRGELVCLRRRSRFQWFGWRNRWELVCLRRKWRFQWFGWRNRWELEWSISPVDDASSITTKIESKMNTAKALGAVITALMVFLATDALLSTPTVYEWLAFVAFGTSAAGYFGALFLYDSLLMPSNFWGSKFPESPATADKSSTSPPDPGPGVRRTLEAARDRICRGRPGVKRPPSPTDRVLAQAMVAIWNLLFRPATYFVGAGLVLLALSAAYPGTHESQWRPDGVMIVAFAAAWILTLASWISATRPRLGVSD